MKTIDELKRQYDSLTYEIIGAAMEVHREMGCGFLEPVYGDALAIEFRKRGIPFKREEKIEIHYKGETIDHYYIADFICFDRIIIELKAVNELIAAHDSQVLNYLNATGIEVGLLINFGETCLKHRRFFNTSKNPTNPLKYNQRVHGIIESDKSV